MMGGIYDVPVGVERKLPPPSFHVNGIEVPGEWFQFAPGKYLVKVPASHSDYGTLLYPDKSNLDHTWRYYEKGRRA